MSGRSGQDASRRFVARPWPEVRESFAALAAKDAAFSYMVEVVESVHSSGHADQLRATTSMHDLLVAVSPAQEPPSDVIAVRAPGSLRAPAAGNVVVEHLFRVGFGRPS